MHMHMLLHCATSGPLPPAPRLISHLPSPISHFIVKRTDHLLLVLVLLPFGSFLGLLFLLVVEELLDRRLGGGGNDGGSGSGEGTQFM